MKIKIAALMLALCLFFTGCTAGEKEGAETDRLIVVATLFPQYDFAREIGGDLVEVTLLLTPGIESHSYEPTPADIIRINESDVFLYTGEYMEPWAHTIAESMEGDALVTDVSKGVSLEADEDEIEHGGFDPHIWTDPVRAMQMAENVAEAFISRDGAHTDTYRKNLAAYLEKLSALDHDIAEFASSLTEKDIYFGGRFAMRYFAERYGFICHAAYDSCSSETEPSARAVAEIIDGMRESGAKAVFYEELVNPTVANAIAEETGTKALLLHSCHNVSRDEFNAGASYLSLMRQNLEHLKEGLS